MVHVPGAGLYVNGKPLGTVPCLAICQDIETKEALLLFCDDQWNSLGIASCASLTEAKERAEREYRGVSTKWINVNASEADVARYLKEQWDTDTCSFCGKRPDEINRMFQSDRARICDECIAAFYHDIRGT